MMKPIESRQGGKTVEKDEKKAYSKMAEISTITVIILHFSFVMQRLLK